MKILPAEVTPERRTPDFTKNSTPAGLLREHHTAVGVWAKIVVLEGTMIYRILEPEIEEIRLSPGVWGVIEPQIRHEVVPHDGVRFYIEFYQEDSIREP